MHRDEITMRPHASADIPGELEEHLIKLMRGGGRAPADSSRRRRTLMNFSGQFGNGPGEVRFDFGDDPDNQLDLECKRKKECVVVIHEGKLQ